MIPVIVENWKIDNWSGYTAFQPYSTALLLGLQSNNSSYPISIRGQDHIDLRTFATSTEAWSTGTVGPQSSINYWPGLAATISTTTHFISNLPAHPVDLTALDDANAILALALPTFTEADVNVAGSSITLSDALGGSVSLPWSSSTYSLTNGPTALTWPYSALTGGTLDPTQVTEVQITVAGTSSASIVMMGLRLLGSNWGLTNIDYDNFNGRVRQTIPVNGNHSLQPVASNVTFPPLFRTSGATEGPDPEPIDSTIGYLLYTGQSIQQNSMTIFMREVEESYPTMNDLEGELMANLTGKPQPGPTAAPGQPIWYQFKLAWGVNTSVQISATSGPMDGYVYTPSVFSSLALSANTYYLIVNTILSTTARVQIYNVDQTTFAIEGTVFDTTVIPDSFMFKRRAGRLGFQALIADGNAFVADVRPRSLVFAEYRSAPLQSITPVQGARLYVNQSQNAELWSSWSPYTTSSTIPTVANDYTKATDQESDGYSTRITIVHPSPTDDVQGVQSNVLSTDAVTGITNFNEFTIHLDVWVPEVDDGSFKAALLSSTGDQVPLNFPALVPNIWNHQVPFSPTEGVMLQSGLWTMLFYYEGDDTPTFWVDGQNINERLIGWSARSVTDDPWFSNYAPWTPFNDLINSDTDGVYFGIRGPDLQVRAQAFNQGAKILSAPNIVPKYGQLGRFVWPEDLDSLPSPPTANFSGSSVALVATLDGTGTSTVAIVDYYWDFGDGTFGIGQNVSHTYGGAADYSVTLTVVDQYGQTGTHTATVDIT